MWINAIIDDAKASAVPEIKGLGRILNSGVTPILAWHTTGAASGPTEGSTQVIKKIKRVSAAGFTNFADYDPAKIETSHYHVASA